jgi:hypothetical protein
MQKSQRTYVLIGVLVVCAVVLGLTLRGRKAPKPIPTVSGYYSGPMRNKNDPSIYSTEAGQVVKPPAGASTAGSWEPVDPKKQERAGTVKD